MNSSINQDFIDLDVSRSLYEDLEELKELDKSEEQVEIDGIDSHISELPNEDLEANEALVKSESKIHKRNPSQIKKAKKKNYISTIQTRSKSAKERNNSLILRPPNVQISSGTINFVHNDIFIIINYK